MEEAEEEEEEEEDGADLKAKYLALNAKEEAKAARLAALSGAEGGVKGEGEGEGEDAEAEAEAGKKKPAAPAPAPKRPSDVTEGRTIFVRNVPFDSDEPALVEQFKAFGRVVYAKIVKDKATGVSRGTAFVQVRRP